MLTPRVCAAPTWVTVIGITPTQEHMESLNTVLLVDSVVDKIVVPYSRCAPALCACVHVPMMCVCVPPYPHM